MARERGPLTYITLTDDKHQPLGAVACGGADWSLNCGQCSYAAPSSSPAAAVTDLLAHIEQVHVAAPVVEIVEVVQRGK
jgi:hypothetical protein